MTNTTVAQPIAEVEAAANEARRIWDAACDAERAARAAGDLDAVLATSRAERVANAAWKASERALQAMWRDELAADEEARLQAMCEAHDALEWDYSDYSDGSLGEPIPYTLTTAGTTYLDHHYATHSNA